MNPGKRRYGRLAAGAALIGLLVFLFYQYELSRFADLGIIRSWVAMAGVFGPLVFILICVAGVILHLPEMVMIAAGALLFGGVKGFFLGWAGSIIGSSCTFLFVRFFMRDIFQNSAAGKLSYFQGIDGFLTEKGFRTVLILRVALFMAPPLNWAIAVTSVSFPSYLAGSMIGIIPGVAITCYAAESIVRMKSFSDFLTTEFALPALLFLAMISAGGLSGWWLFKRRARAN